jgi:hypothetical protein
MTWTVNDNVRDRLAGSHSLQTALGSGKLRIYTSSDALLSEHDIGTVTVNDNVLTVPFNSSTVVADRSNQTATKAEIRASNADVLLLTDDVGTTGADIPFNTATGWNSGDTVAPGNATITLTVGIAV